ncbi:Inactive peptidyl-prolyl cis-trans isomerase shutdown [Eumeta japonica]|uniref:peptidylprolyl isomerase n=1 Tax=Eumeta variegata TaxID=151549 RepID=A0A4C1VJT7_EUMVA|nr:Inactive peptidyl-prolyl cis-trans isomerase shutdown [Eumeta japonica]
MDSDNQVVLDKGINFQELMSKSGTEFQINLDFERNKSNQIFSEQDLFNDEDDSTDAKDALDNIEHTAKIMMLTSPGYQSFDELATKMVDCISTGDVKMLMIEDGDGDLVPTDAVVLLHYAAYWEHEKIPFDTTLTTETGSPRKLRLGVDQILPGLEIGLTMVHGPKARFQLLLTPEVTWGKLGVLKRIRNERCLFCVTLVEVQDVGAVESFNSLPSAQQKQFEVTIKTVTACNMQAKDYFTKKLYKKAKEKYHKSLSVLQICVPDNDYEMNEIKKLLTKVYTNLALCYIKLNLPYKVLLMCDDLAKCTDIGKHCKGLYYYGKAFSMLGQYEEALKFLKKASKLEPKNAEISSVMAEVDDILSKSAEKEKEMWKNAFKGRELEKPVVQAEKNIDVDEDFKKNLKETCESLNKRVGFVKIELPNGIQKNEIDYAKSLIKHFDKLCLDEEKDYPYWASMVSERDNLVETRIERHAKPVAVGVVTI